MQNEIASYLFQNRICPLPGLGTLTIVNAASAAHFGNKQITAPQPSIQFTNKETDAVGLINYVAASTESNKDEATEALDHFCDKLQKDIAEQKNIKLENIGSFSVDQSGTIHFTQEELPAYFFQPVFAERVIHPDAEHQILVGDRETTNTVMTELLSPKTETKDNWWIWAIVLGLIGAALIILYFNMQNGAASFGNAIKI
jgi:hypothetical protein